MVLAGNQRNNSKKSNFHLTPKAEARANASSPKGDTAFACLGHNYILTRVTSHLALLATAFAVAPIKALIPFLECVPRMIKSAFFFSASVHISLYGFPNFTATFFLEMLSDFVIDSILGNTFSFNSFW